MHALRKRVQALGFRYEIHLVEIVRSARALLFDLLFEFEHRRLLKVLISESSIGLLTECLLHFSYFFRQLALTLR